MCIFIRFWFWLYRYVVVGVYRYIEKHMQRIHIKRKVAGLSGGSVYNPSY
jgi:hypothetical protein